MDKVTIIPGPPTSRVSKAKAEETLTTNPNFPKGASYTLAEVEGRWVAAYHVAGEPPFGGDDEGGDDSAPEEKAPPKDDGAPDGPPSDDGASADSSDGEDKPKGEHGKGEGGQLDKIEHMLETLLGALGLGGPDASMMPGDEVPGGPPMPPGGPDAMGGPPGPPAGGPDGKTHTVHERALKPGEAPPGTTPVGSPSFASVQVPEDHPWHAQITAGQAEWRVADAVGADESVAKIAAELRELAAPYGYRVDQINVRPDESGRRIARAKITR